ncbi:MAG TPA: hypothetical protein VH796_03590 [Nitrososphaeraceae archaeon]
MIYPSLTLLFFDEISKELFKELPQSNVASSKVMLNIDSFNIGQSYVTAKIENRFGDKIGMNIQGGSGGIELQETLFNLPRLGKLQFAYLLTKLKDNGSLLLRKLPILGVRDWLLVYDDTLFLLAVKDAYDELEILVV